MAKVSSSSRSRFSSLSRSNPVKRSSLLTGNCCLMAVYAHAGKGTLLFPKIPYKSLENSRYETLRKKLSSVPFCLYCCLSFILNFPAANLRLQFWRQTRLNRGCCVMHFKVTSALISRRTRSVFIDSRQPSSSLQQ